MTDELCSVRAVLHSFNVLGWVPQSQSRPAQFQRTAEGEDKRGKCRIRKENCFGNSLFRICFIAFTFLRSGRKPNCTKCYLTLVVADRSSEDLPKYNLEIWRKPFQQEDIVFSKVKRSEHEFALASVGIKNLLLRGTQLKVGDIHQSFPQFLLLQNTKFIYGCAVYTGRDTKMSQVNKWLWGASIEDSCLFV